MYVNRGRRKLFYLSRRVDGKPKKFYVGDGPRAETLAAEIEGRKLTRKATAEACASRSAKVRAAEQPLDELCASLDYVITATLLVLGFHRHDRGNWRKRRGRPEAQAERTERTDDPPDVQAVIAAANAGDRSAARAA